MLILSLSGIYLWWPRNLGFVRGLRWRRGPTLSLNLHHLVGIWISIPLAVVSATGIYLGFPQQARELLGSMAPLTPPQRGGFNAPLMRSPALGVDEALAAARAAEPGAQPAAIFMPTQQAQAWRVQVRAGQSGETATLMVDDRTRAVSRVTPQSGDRIASWIRWIHEGSHSGAIWQVLVFLTGVAPTLFAITGVLIWLRKRRNRAAMAVGAVPQLGPAE